MTPTDNIQELTKFDTDRIVDSFNGLAKQIIEAYGLAGELKLAFKKSSIKNIVVCGMGGSNLASEFVRASFADQLKVPITLLRGYNLPGFVNSQTMVVCSSYSGNTEEVLSAFKQAVAKKSKIVVITTGGKLFLLAKKHKKPVVKLSRRFNPSKQPRYGVGSQLGALLSVFSSLRLIKLSKSELEDSAEYLDILGCLFGVENSSDKNPAKQVARDLSGFAPIVVAAEHLSANARIFSNQVNESAKNLAMPFLIPELNHHLMEGLALPTKVVSKIKFVFFDSSLYSQNIQKRFLVTQKVLKKQKIGFINYRVESENRLMSGLEVLLFGSWVSFYLAFLNGQKPAQVPWVDFFKKELKK